jgi:hypothetical protein
VTRYVLLSAYCYGANQENAELVLSFQVHGRRASFGELKSYVCLSRQSAHAHGRDHPPFAHNEISIYGKHLRTYDEDTSHHQLMLASAMLMGPIDLTRLSVSPCSLEGYLLPLRSHGPEGYFCTRSGSANCLPGLRASTKRNEDELHDTHPVGRSPQWSSTFGRSLSGGLIKLIQGAPAVPAALADKQSVRFLVGFEASSIRFYLRRW